MNDPSPMADTELLRLCDEMLNGLPTGDETLGHIKDCCTLARALKSRLQAEAPENAEVAEIEKRHAFMDQHPNARYTRHHEPEGYYAVAHRDRAALLEKLRARTSQSEAQAFAVTRPDMTTTLDKADELYIELAYCRHVDLPISEIVKRVRALLPTPAPAPAPTQAAQDALIDALDKTGIPATVERAREKAAPAPTREQIAPLIDKEAFTPLDSTIDYPRWINERAFRQENAYRKAESILALFAKGGDVSASVVSESEQSRPWHRLPICWLGMCPHFTNSDDTGCWGECSICGNRAGFVTRDQLRAYLNREHATPPKGDTP